MSEEQPDFIKNWRQGQEDMKIMELLENTEVKNIGDKMDPPLSESAVRGRLFRIPRRLARFQWYINNWNNLQRRSKRIRKFTTLGELAEEEEDLLE